MCEHWDVTKILTDYNLLKEEGNFTGATAKKVGVEMQVDIDKWKIALGSVR